MRVRVRRFPKSTRRESRQSRGNRVEPYAPALNRKNDMRREIGIAGDKILMVGGRDSSKSGRSLLPNTCSKNNSLATMNSPSARHRRSLAHQMSPGELHVLLLRKRYQSIKCKFCCFARDTEFLSRVLLLRKRHHCTQNPPDLGRSKYREQKILHYSGHVSHALGGTKKGKQLAWPVRAHLDGSDAALGRVAAGRNKLIVFPK